ncbi:MAG TPA: lipocalin-like domain-containing protein [Anaerolineaceae bacterium]|nr:lipocalin-like domain-containing protein [Anaerolineaceae bacterium]
MNRESFRVIKPASRWLILLALVAGLACLIWPQQQPAPGPAFDGFAMTPDPGFAHAEGPISFNFPNDFGPHPDFQTEWWYYTGNLQAATGDHFGFELTFFRRALVPPAQMPTRSSDWAANQIYMAHFALTGVRDNSFHPFERFSRGAAGLAGATGLPVYQAWLEDWLVEQTGPRSFHLSASDSGAAIDLNLEDLKGPVLQGDHGYSQKGPQPGNASFYFSQTRLQTKGTLKLGDNAFQVNGLSWMDHEYSTSALDTDQVGWDWFAIQLDDGSELTIYDLRRKDGSIDAYSRGLIVRPDGTTQRLTTVDFAIHPEATWKSPRSGATYPSRWTLSISSENLELQITPYIADQELRLSFTYWEGAVQVQGAQNGKHLAGSGYVELTGYFQSLQGQF